MTTLSIVSVKFIFVVSVCIASKDDMLGVLVFGCVA